MKYLAICLLSVVSLFTTAGAWPASSSQLQNTVPALAHVMKRDASLGDRALALIVAAALVGIQLRRRQKSLHMPRQLS
jgi:uncharacterized membrane protein